jgi:hypothetical protein
MDLGSEIRKKPFPDPGPRGQKGTGSRIRIRNTGHDKNYFSPLSFVTVFGSGSGMDKIRIRDNHHGSATLLKIVFLMLKFCAMLRIRIRDFGSGDFLTPGSGMGKKSGSRSGMNNQETIFRLQYFLLYGSGM